MYARGTYAGGPTEPGVTTTAHMRAAKAARVTAETTGMTTAMLRPRRNGQEQREYRKGSQPLHTTRL